MIKKIAISILLLYFLTLLQTSFFVHFFVFLPNFVLLSIILINLVEDQKSNFGIASGFIGGFFLDLFSENYIGSYILISLLLSIFIKLVIKEYIQPKFSFKL
ncbi:MAG: rod shape-determining protein MreD [Patescibacteria group bacterium]|nr:rod shape-determining protein MreD [Patescibacteria group bacterium]